MKSPITVKEISDLDNKAGERLQTYFIWEVLQCLFDVKDFSIDTHIYSNDISKLEPEPLDPLPHGLDHATKQFMLGTVEIDKSTYEGTDRLIDE